MLIGGKFASLLYASNTQIDAIVPDDSVGPSATVQVRANRASQVWTVPVAAAAPEIFTQDSTGVGLGAILNEDNSLNSVERLAARGSVVQIYVTGIPIPGVPTGTFNPANPIRAAIPVEVSIGGVPAKVQYAGTAPGAVAGLVQINAEVPQEVAPGLAEVIVTAAGAKSAGGVVVAVL